MEGVANGEGVLIGITLLSGSELGLDVTLGLTLIEEVGVGLVETLGLGLTETLGLGLAEALGLGLGLAEICTFDPNTT